MNWVLLLATIPPCNQIASGAVSDVFPISQQCLFHQRWWDEATPHTHSLFYSLFYSLVSVAVYSYTACPLHLSVNGRWKACLTDGGTRLQWNLPHITQSDWLTDPSQPEKLKFSQLLKSRDGADATDGPTMHFVSPHTKSMRCVKGRMQWASAVTFPLRVCCQRERNGELWDRLFRYSHNILFDILPWFKINNNEKTAGARTEISWPPCCSLPISCS